MVELNMAVTREVRYNTLFVGSKSKGIHSDWVQKTHPQRIKIEGILELSNITLTQRGDKNLQGENIVRSTHRVTYMDVFMLRNKLAR